MSSFLRPRRGKQSTAVSTLTASNPLKRGEIFFEVPTGGVGTGTGKLKMGDGSTAYANLPYFLSMDDSVVTFTDSSASSSWDNYSNYLANIKTGITLPTFFANTKNLLYQLCSKVTSLNNDLDKTKKYISIHSESIIIEKESSVSINIDFTNYIYLCINYYAISGGFRFTSEFKNDSTSYNFILIGTSGFETTDYLNFKYDKNTKIATFENRSKKYSCYIREIYGVINDLSI